MRYLSKDIKLWLIGKYRLGLETAIELHKAEQLGVSKQGSLTEIRITVWCGQLHSVKSTNAQCRERGRDL